MKQKHNLSSKASGAASAGFTPPFPRQNGLGDGGTQNYKITVNKWGWKERAGFTLIELLVVIAIIGLLATTVMLSASSARVKARDGKRTGDVQQLAKSLELFFNEVRAYPTGTGALGSSTNYVCLSPGCGGQVFGSAPLVAHNVLTDTEVSFTPTYLTTLPASPLPPDGGCSVSDNQYWYEADSAGTVFTLTFCLGRDVTSEIKAGRHFITPAGIQ